MTREFASSELRSLSMAALVEATISHLAGPAALLLSCLEVLCSRADLGEGGRPCNQSIPHEGALPILARVIQVCGRWLSMVLHYAFHIVGNVSCSAPVASDTHASQPARPLLPVRRTALLILASSLEACVHCASLFAMLPIELLLWR